MGPHAPPKLRRFGPAIAVAVACLLTPGEASSTYTAKSVFSGSTCSAPPLKVTFDKSSPCTTPALTCVADGSRYSNSDCTNDHAAFAATAFGENNPYLLVTTYDSGSSCGTVSASTAYIADGVCHANADGSTSFKASLDTTTGDVTLIVYSDATCTTATTTTSVVKADLGACKSDMKVTLGGLTTKKTVVALYASDDATCAKSPVQLTFTSAYTCNDAACAKKSGSTLTSKGSCVADPAAFAATAFGENNPYLLVNKYDSGSSCATVSDTKAYVADGACHTDEKATTSFKASLDTTTGDVTLIVYSDAKCTTATTTTSVVKADLGACKSDMKVTLGGIVSLTNEGKLTALAVYSDSACEKKPVQLVFSDETTCTVAPADPTLRVCVPLGNTGLYGSTNCTDDYGGLADSLLVGSRYIMMEIFEDGSKCTKRDALVAYVADAKCHAGMDGGVSSFRVTIGSDGSASIELFSAAKDCTGVKDLLAISKDSLSQHACFEGNMRFYVGGKEITPPATTPSITPSPTPTTSAPETPSTPAPTPTTTTSTGSGTSGAPSYSSASMIVMLVTAFAASIAVVFQGLY